MANEYQKDIILVEVACTSRIMFDSEGNALLVMTVFDKWTRR